jgi:hypothetical protein
MNPTFGAFDPHEHLYPFGRTTEEEAPYKIKGSLALADLYRKYTLTYDKRRSGRILARCMPRENAAIRDLCKPLLSLTSMEETTTQVAQV